MAILTAAVCGPAAVAGTGPERGFRGCLAVRGDEVVAAENAAQLFTPASVTKLVVTATALHHLGPDYRITTRVLAGGRLSGGTLDGDLVVEAAADPTWSKRFFAGDPRAPLEDLAGQLRRRGLGRVSGDLVIDVHRFPGRTHALSRPLSELAFGFAAPASALAVDENAVAVEIAPGRKVGDPGSAKIAGNVAGLRIEGSLRTVSRQRHGKGTVDFQPLWGRPVILVRGEYPVSEPPYRIDVAVPDADHFAGEALLAALRREGIEVAGNVRISLQPAAATGAVLASFRSPTLAALLPPILTESNNWLAEMLLRRVAAEVLGEGRDDEGLELERRFLEDAVGLAPESFQLDDASGLSPYNLLTPEAVVEILRWVWRQPWHRHFADALARPGKGTLEAWRGLPPTLAAKTGMIRDTVALAGYVQRPAGGEPLTFACFLNHRPGDRGALRAEIVGLLRRW